MVGISHARSRVALLPVTPKPATRGGLGETAPPGAVLCGPDWASHAAAGCSADVLGLVGGGPGGGCPPRPRAALLTSSVLRCAGHGVPFGIIFGGTDVNEDVNDGEKHQAMGRVLQEARYCRPRARDAVRRWALPRASPRGQRDGGGRSWGRGAHTLPQTPASSSPFVSGFFPRQIFALPRRVLVTECGSRYTDVLGVFCTVGDTGHSVSQETPLRIVPGFVSRRVGT